MSEQIELTNELGSNFIEYAMAVNTDRVFPDTRTGLKPVHRRIIYDSYIKGHTSNKVHVKCANVVGETMAEFHPHGDSSIYDALVRLSRKWIMRYPLIDFHGNNGNIAGDPPAHYRYTECRLAKITEEGLLAGIKKDAVDFIPNYCESTTEPATLPSYFPNLLCNPNSGIGVAMACSWLPHNLREVEQAILDYLDGKEPTLPGPDFPTGGLIINKDDLENIIACGHGSVKLRGQYKIEGNKIIFYEIPYGLTTESIIEEIGAAADEGKLNGVNDVHDESNRKGLRIVIEIAKDTSIQDVIATLFQETSLQTSLSYNQIGLVDKQPISLGLKDCIKIYIDHGMDCIKRESEFDKIKVEARIEILEGLLKALEDIDNIIALIKKSESSAKAKENLISKYKFTEPQAKAIIDMKLGKLAGLEKIEIQEEYNKAKASLEDLIDIIANDSHKQRILIERLHAIVETYGDPRRTQLSQIDVSKKKQKEIVPDPVDCVITISNRGFIKRIPKKIFKIQRRNTVGIKTNGDITIFSTSTNTQDILMIFSSKGKMYRVLVNNIPEGTNTSTGILLSNLVNFEENETPIAYTTLARDNKNQYIFFATKRGIIKKVSMSEYDSAKRTGIASIKLKEGDSLACITFINQEEMILVTKKGMSIRFATDTMPLSSRIAQGVKGMNVAEDDYVIAALPISGSDKYLAVVSEDGLGKKTELKEFCIQNRGGKGVLCYKGKLSGAILLNQDDNILISGNSSSIVVSEKDLPLLNRTSLGNVMIKNNKSVVSISKV